MLGHALNPKGLITRSRNIAESYNFMSEQYPELQTVGRQFGDRIETLKDFYIENDHGGRYTRTSTLPPPPQPKTAVIVHGYTDNAVRMLMIFFYLCQQGDGLQHLAARPPTGTG